MKNKFFILCVTLLFVLSLAGCARNNNTATKDNTANKQNTTENGVVDNNGQEYYDIYTRNYNASLAPLQENYTMYGDLNTVEDYYKENQYPGNEKYLQEVKDALNDSKDNVEKFVNSMEKDAKSNDEEINKMNREMIDDGRDLIEDIDESLRRLNNITDQDLNRPEAEFRSLVHKNIKIEDDRDNDFRDMLRNLERKLGIERNDNTMKNK